MYNNAGTFEQYLRDSLESFNREQQSRFAETHSVRIDLHCHDCNSDEPDEQLGRILGVPETWLPTRELHDILLQRGSTCVTITNHNNARSCWELLDQGKDILPGAEFSVMVPDSGTGIHVLTYGFTPAQEAKLEKLRSNVYRFLEFTRDHDLPTVWAHPLFHYTSRSTPPLEFFERMSLLFERYEVMNGQRDTWQSMLVKDWVLTLTPEKLEENSRKHGIATNEFCRHPYRRIMTGGSDDHMGIFAGLTGTRLHLPDSFKPAQYANPSEYALEALRHGETAPYGDYHNSEKMAIAFIDYFCQIGLNMNDPGLLRMLLHKGSPATRVGALLIANGFLELKRHKLTSEFLTVFHQCLKGQQPGFIKKLMVPADYKPVFSKVSEIASIRRADKPEMADDITRAMTEIFTSLNDLIVKRLTTKLQNNYITNFLTVTNPQSFMERLELPGDIRALFGATPSHGSRTMSTPDLSSFADGLSFPFLAMSVLLGATFTSARVLYNTRPLLDRFAQSIGSRRHPQRTLWLTDTFEDINGVAMVLNSILHEIQKRDLPIDIMVCSSTLESQDHLIVIPPRTEFSLPFYPQQPFRLPNIMTMHDIFRRNEYDRVVCSTEGFMGLATLFLKFAYSVPAFFYIHTDWMMFARQTLNFDRHNRNRLRRILRAFYRCFDGLMVLNSDQRDWLSSPAMGIPAEKVLLTAHWTDSAFSPKKTSRTTLFGLEEHTPLVLFAGRVSKEKGVGELPEIWKTVKERIPGARLAIAGKGPAEDDLRASLPDVIFCGWVDHDRLPEYYSAADVLVLPSRFDTFGCVILEAMSCGTPVVSYDTKGPKDIIDHLENGFLASNKKDMAHGIIKILESPETLKKFSASALKRAEEYNPDIILKDLMKFIRSTN